MKKNFIGIIVFIGGACLLFFSAKHINIYVFFAGGVFVAVGMCVVWVNMWRDVSDLGGQLSIIIWAVVEHAQIQLFQCAISVLPTPLNIDFAVPPVAKIVMAILVLTGLIFWPVWLACSVVRKTEALFRKHPLK